MNQEQINQFKNANFLAQTF